MLEKAKHNETGELLKLLRPYQRNERGLLQNGYRRKLIWVFRRRDNSTCRICGGPGHNVHHILSKKDYPHWKKCSDNLISLCKKHHDAADAGFFPIEYLFSLIPQ